MRDPFPFSCPPFLARAIKPFADYYGLQTLHLHIHEILFVAVAYQLIGAVVSPWLSARLFPRTYPFFNRRTRINWDVHVVSFVQSCLINVLALWVLWSEKNEARGEMGVRSGEAWKERIWGYTGAEGMIQAFATGYFVWDLWVSVRYLKVFGLGMLAHAVSALGVYALGFRPFVNFYAPIFILYELSSPFLNIHWFCDKLSLTGSTLQLCNGVILIVTFFSCRLIWGSYQTLLVFADIYRGLTHTATMHPREPLGSSLGALDRLRFVAPKDQATPVWLAGAYLAANITLNTLNFVWFGKMIATIRTRFEPPFGTKAVGKRRDRSVSEPVVVQGIDVDTDEEGVSSTTEVARGLDERGHASVEVEKVEVRKRAVGGGDGEE
ncbi:DUF887-domain-containing protein [Pseudovirgaria hyperparasitica]|uniref:DUF887-domain-containing protein n=1 Tax=Pseudovirgaria hyperparasitica TaxID=470096 RepID=A0A6A6W8B0_9PEZI|nr:DUF887-domain-containing protein [Pseudovirgaria hyperparasitica]KAF2758449.1 DUF887-domain-containing protein [Pseudovirgaria hyperparasitica]